MTTILSNRNATLGQSDGNDRIYPDQVTLRPAKISSHTSIRDRYSPVSICDVAMGKLHTGI